MTLKKSGISKKMCDWFCVKALIALTTLFMSGSVAQAAIGDVYSDTFQGVTFTFTQTDADTLTFRLEGDLPLSPDWQTAQYLGAFDLKDLGLDFGTVTATANGPGATNLAGLNEQLSASSVDCDSMASPPGSICFDISPDFTLTDPFDLTYTIDFSADLNISSSGPHLQIVFTATENGPKVGSLYSENVPLTDGGTPTTDTPTTDVPVPEPSAFLLAGSGLLIGGFLVRRLRRR